MNWIEWTLVGGVVYLVIGIIFALMLQQTPYAETSFAARCLLWPVFLANL